MADKYDGDVKLKVSLTTDDVKRTALELRKILQDALSGIGDKDLSKSAKSAENSGYKIIKQADAIMAKMRELEGQTFKSDEFVELEKELANFEQDYRKLKMKMEEHIAIGGKTSDKSFKRMQYQLQQLENQIEGTKYEMEELKDWGTAFIPGTQTAEYAELARQLNAINAEMTAVKSSESNISAEHIDNLGQSTEKASNGVRRLIDRFMEFMRMLGGTTSELQRTSSATDQQTDADNQLSESEERVEKSAKKAASGVRQVADKRHVSNLNNLRLAFNNVGRSSNNFSRKLKQGIRQVLRYTLGISSLMILFNKFRAAFIEGFSNLQKYSQPLGQSIQALKDSLFQLKNQLAASFSPIVTAVLPYIQTFINALNAAISKVGQFIAALAGKKTWTRAKLVSTAVSDGMDDAASATGAANEAAQEYKKTLMGFDDVNILQEPNKSSGSGGGAGAAGKINQINPEDMFEEVQIDSDIMGIADALRAMVEAGDWEGVGRTISDKLADMLRNINWESIKEKAANFGTNLAEFLNGFISPDLFGEVGRTIAEALNTAIEFAYSFGTTFDFVNLGESIAAAISEFFRTFDFYKLGATIRTWVGGLTDALATAITEIDWKAVFKGIADFFMGLGIDGLVNIIGLVAIGKLISTFKALIKSKISEAVKGGAKEGLNDGLEDGVAEASKGISGKSFDIGTVKLLVGITFGILWFLDKFGNKIADTSAAAGFNKFIASEFEGVDEIDVSDATDIRIKLGYSLDLDDIQRRIIAFANGEGWFSDTEKAFQNAAKAIGGSIKNMVLGQIASDFGVWFYNDMSASIQSILDSILEWFATSWGIDAAWDWKTKMDAAFEADRAEKEAMAQAYQESLKADVQDEAKQARQQLLKDLDKIERDAYNQEVRQAKQTGKAAANAQLKEQVKGFNNGSKNLYSTLTGIKSQIVSDWKGAGQYGSWDGLGSLIVNNIADGALREQAKLHGGIQQIIETDQGLLWMFADGTIEVGEAIPTNMAQGVQSNESAATLAALRVGQDSHRAMVDGLELMELYNKGAEATGKVGQGTRDAATLSTAKTNASTTGKDIGQSEIDGIKSKDTYGAGKYATQQAGKGVTDTKTKNDVTSKAKTVGTLMVDGIIAGINVREAILEAKIRRMADNINKQFRNAEVIKSPSRVFMQYGEYITEGLAIGIGNEEQKAINAVEKVSTAVNKAGATAIPAVVRGAVVPHTALSGTASTAAAVANKPITRDELETMLSRVVAKYMNIDFYIGDEQISRHADAGKQKIGKKYNPVLA